MAFKIARCVFAALLFAVSWCASADTPTAPTIAAPTIANHRCLRCHADKEEKQVVKPDGSRKNIFIDPEVLKRSVHADEPCTGCHSSITKLPHQKPLPPSIGCVECHQQRWAALAKDPNADAKKLERLGVVMEQTHTTSNRRTHDRIRRTSRG